MGGDTENSSFRLEIYALGSRAKDKNIQAESDQRKFNIGKGI